MKSDWSIENVIDIIIFGICDPLVQSTVRNVNCKSLPELNNVLSGVSLRSNDKYDKNACQIRALIVHLLSNPW